jgi:hypothetical protein
VPEYGDRRCRVVKCEIDGVKVWREVVSVVSSSEVVEVSVLQERVTPSAGV